MDDWFESGRGGALLPVHEMFTAGVVDAVIRLLEQGALVSVCVSRDGGAIGFTVTSDGRWSRQWFREPAQAEEWMTAGSEYLAANPPAAADRQQDTRFPRGGRRKA